MLHLFRFQSENLELRKAYEVEGLHVLSQSALQCVSQVSSKSDKFQGKSASEEKVVKPKRTKFTDARPTLLPISESRVKESVGSRN